MKAIDLLQEEIKKEILTQIKPLDEVLTTKEASEMWNIHISTIRKAIESGKFIEGIDYKKSGRTWLITRCSMQRVFGNLK